MFLRPHKLPATLSRVGESFGEQGVTAEGTPVPSPEELATTLRSWSAAVICAALAGLIILTFANPWVFTADDSLFYLVVAKHIAANGAWTFNGLIPTNGVQPLWQLATAGVVALGGLVGLDSPVAKVRMLFALNWALALFALAQMWRLLGRLSVSDPYRMGGVVVLGACLCGPWGLFASEAHAVAVCLLWLLILVERWFRNGPAISTAIAAGCASGLMMLSRLDTVWVAATAFMCLLLAPSGAAILARLRSVLPTAVVAAAIVVPYLAWNMARFGHLAPISGSIKVDLGSPQLSVEGIGLFGVAILSAIWIGGFMGVLRAPRQPSVVAVWLVPSLGAAVSSAFYVVFSRGAFTTWYWYYIPHAVALALTVPLLATRLVNDRPELTSRAAKVSRISFAAVAVVGLAFCTVRYAFGPPNKLWGEAREFSLAVSEVLPEGAPLATVDMPGVLALFSGHPVVALDGLTGDFDFQDSLRDNGVSCTMSALGIDYVVTVDDRRVVQRDESSVTLAIYSWLHLEGPTEMTGSGPLLVSPDRDYALWRLDPACPTGR